MNNITIFTIFWNILIAVHSFGATKEVSLGFANFSIESESEKEHAIVFGVQKRDCEVSGIRFNVRKSDARLKGIYVSYLNGSTEFIDLKKEVFKNPTDSPYYELTKKGCVSRFLFVGITPSSQANLRSETQVELITRIGPKIGNLIQIESSFPLEFLNNIRIDKAGLKSFQIRIPNGQAELSRIFLTYTDHSQEEIDLKTYITDSSNVLYVGGIVSSPLFMTGSAHKIIESVTVEGSFLEVYNSGWNPSIEIWTPFD